MRFKKEYKKCMMFNLKVKKAILENDLSILNTAEEIGNILNTSDDLRIIKKSIIDALKKVFDEVEMGKIDLIIKVLEKIDITETRILSDRIKIKAAKDEDEIRKMVKYILEKNYGNEAKSEDIFILYSAVIQKVTYLQDNELIKLAIEKIESIEEA